MNEPWPFPSPPRAKIICTNRQRRDASNFPETPLNRRVPDLQLVRRETIIMACQTAAGRLSAGRLKRPRLAVQAFAHASPDHPIGRHAPHRPPSFHASHPRSGNDPPHENPSSWPGPRRRRTVIPHTSGRRASDARQPVHRPCGSAARHGRSGLGQGRARPASRGSVRRAGKEGDGRQGWPLDDQARSDAGLGRPDRRSP